MEENIIKETSPSQLSIEEQIKTYGFFTYSAKEAQDIIQPSGNDKFIIKGLITPGLNILAGPSKCGKSWMCLAIALYIALGEKFWDRDTISGDVFYMALEDSPERMQNRLNKILNYADAPETLKITHHVKGIDEIEKGLPKYLQDHKDTKLVIIDVLQKIRGEISPKQTEYGHDYKEIGTLKKLADQCGVAILLVTHTRKTPDNKNKLNEISGGVGVGGAADTLLVLSINNEKTCTLHVSGRDVETQDFPISFNNETFLWEYLGTKDELDKQNAEKEYASSPAVKTVKTLLEQHGGNWEGNCSMLLEAGSKITGSPIAKSTSALGRMLRHFVPMFEKNNITYIQPDKNGGINGRIHKFYTNSPASCDSEAAEAALMDMFEDDELPFGMP